MEAPVAVFEMVRLLPPVFNPSIVTLSAQFKFIRFPVMAPLIVLAAPPEGEITIDV